MVICDIYSRKRNHSVGFTRIIIRRRKCHFIVNLSTDKKWLDFLNIILYLEFFRNTPEDLCLDLI